MVASRCAADGHLISGIAKKIQTYSELMGEKITSEVAEKLLADTLHKTRTPLSAVKSMCEKIGVSYDAVCSPSRERGIVRARQIMMTALKAGTKLSLTEIGRLLGDRDHATVLYGIKCCEKMKASDMLIAAEIDRLISDF
jgi:chromosomal replication initiator protein